MRNRVRIVSPAGKHREDSEATLKKGIKLLEESGFIVSVQENIFGEVKPPFYANTKEARLEGLREAILAEDIDIIWAFRGGVGCGELADLCMDIKPNDQKILIGFSDLTYLHFLFNQHYKIPSIHGTVITSAVEKYPQAIEEIVSLLKGEELNLDLKSLNESAKGNIAGELLGGNLTIITTMIGTKNHPDLKDKILLIEEVNEPGFRIARLFTHLEKAGLLGGLKAMIIADFDNCMGYYDEAIEAFVESNPDLPIYRLEGVGHGEVNHAVVFGKEAKIENNVLKFGL